MHIYEYKEYINQMLKNPNIKFLFICLSILLVSTSISSWIQSSKGAVEVSSFVLPTQNNQSLAVDFFKPNSATSDNKAPFIVVIPGFQRSKEALSNIAIELARRGFVVASIDPYAQGHSSSSMSRRSATTEGYGMFALVDYVYASDQYNFIDKTRIGATGHSAGGNAAIRGANYFGKESIETGMPSKLHSVFVSGYVLTMRNNVLNDVRSNVGMSYALYDEGAYRNELKNGDMRFAPEALRLVNSIYTKSKKIKEVEIGKIYGNSEDRTLRVIHNEALLHPFQPYNKEATSNQIAYFEKVFNFNPKIDNMNQIWPWKEFFGLVALITALVSIIPMTRQLLTYSFFKSLNNEIPAALPIQSTKGKVIFWCLFILGASIACFSFIPMSELSKELFVAASNREQTWFFPQRMNNAVMMWAVFNGTIGFILFYGSYYFHGKHNGITPELWGISISIKDLVKTAILALSIFVFYYVVLFSLYYALHVDYRFWFMGVRVFQPEMLIVLLMYVPFFFLFFLSNSLRVNGAMRIEGQPEWLSMLIGGIGNSLGLLLIIVIQYVTFALTGTVFWTDGWLYVNLLFAVVPMMFVLPYFNRYFFKMTGRIYLGPMVTSLIFIMILVTNTVCYLPLN